MTNGEATTSDSWGGHTVARRIADGVPRRRMVVTGTVTGIDVAIWRGQAAHFYRFDDGTGCLTLVFSGVRPVPGLVKGAHCTVEATALSNGAGALVLWNPLYRFESPTGCSTRPPPLRARSVRGKDESRLHRPGRGRIELGHVRGMRRIERREFGRGERDRRTEEGARRVLARGRRSGQRADGDVDLGGADAAQGLAQGVVPDGGLGSSGRSMRGAWVGVFPVRTQRLKAEIAASRTQCWGPELGCAVHPMIPNGVSSLVMSVAAASLRPVSPMPMIDV